MPDEKKISLNTTRAYNLVVLDNTSSGSYKVIDVILQHGFRKKGRMNLPFQDKAVKCVSLSIRQPQVYSSVVNCSVSISRLVTV